MRCDDGLGPRIAAAVAEWNSPAISALACHQLTPELAEPIAAAKAVVFVDASAGPRELVRLDAIDSLVNGEFTTHMSAPHCLLRLAKTVFGQFPPAWTLTVPAENFYFGNHFSPLAHEGFQTALKTLRFLADSL
jgi:hydrogenase maturation protease